MTHIDGRINDITNDEQIGHHIQIGRNVFVWIVVAICFLYPRTISGTAIIMYRDSSRIVVGADTLVTYKKRTSKSACKIHRYGNTFVAIAGFTVEPRNKFVAYSVARWATEESDGVIASAKRFAKIGLNPFREAIRIERRESPDYYWHVIKKPPQALSVLFMGMEGAIPTFALATFFISEHPNAQPTISARIDSCPGEKCPPLRAGFGVVEPTILSMGENQETVRGQQSDSFVPNFQLDPAGTIRQLIEGEIRDNPAIVGAPIDILTISRDGDTWNQKGECQ